MKTKFYFPPQKIKTTDKRNNFHLFLNVGYILQKDFVD